MQSVEVGNVHIPALGFGTYGMGHADMLRMIPAAIKGGFRHIDTAQIYRNETEIGECIETIGIPRSEMFLTTKIWVGNYSPRAFAASVEESLRKLRTDYVDLLLLHWPSEAVPLADQIGALNEVARVGKARHIGVSNFNRELMAKAVALSDTPLITNQFEYHPYLNQKIIIEATRQAGLAVTAYCGMAVGRVLKDPVLHAIAARHRRTIAQIVLRWITQQDGVIALSRTTNPERIAENVAIFDFELSRDDMAEIAALAYKGSRIVDPAGLAPDWDPTPA